MGCDIHCYVEFYDELEFSSNKNCRVSSFNYGDLNWGRDYVLFAIMAGVRTSVIPEIPVRGIPDSPYIGYAARCSYYEPDDMITPRPEYHSSTWFTKDELKSIRKKYLIETINFWSDITLKQKKDVLKFIQNTDSKALMDYTFPDFDSIYLYSTICLMEGLEKFNTNIKSRLVCWFDS